MTGRTHTPSRGAQNVPPGTQLNNMFEVDQLLTAGGMGEVYRGHNIQTNDPVAIKIVLPEFAQDEMILQLFRKEARVLNHLHHEAIVRYYVFSIDAVSGLPFLAMEFVDGPSLAERIRDGPLDTASVVTLQRRLADGLQKAHDGGVIHRDIAPDNVILPEGRVDRAKIIDFGIARSAAVGGGTLLGGAFAGKYGYVSPEQLGLFGGEVTHRSDIYSLGLVLAACARGRPLDMTGSQVEVIEKRRVVPDLSDVDAPLIALLEAMLQPDPDHRPQSMAEVAAWPTLEPEPKTEIWRATTRHPTRPPDRQGTHSPSVPPTGAQGLAPTRRPTERPAEPATDAPQTGYPPQPPQTGYPPQPPQTGYPPQPQQAGYPMQAPQTGYRSQPPPMPADWPASDTAAQTPVAPGRSGNRADGRPTPWAERKRTRPGLIVLGLFLLIGLLGGVGGWAYVEYWSNGWYQLAGPPAGEAQVTGDARQAGGTQDADPDIQADGPDTQDADPAIQGADPEIQANGPDTQDADREAQDAAGAGQGPEYTTADIVQYVNGYDGGSCFFAHAAKAGANQAEIIGYGTRREPFDSLDSSFQQRFSFEPVIEFREVSQTQCVVLEALGDLTSQGASRPQLDLTKSIVYSGNNLSGTIAALDGRHLAVVMVDDSGTVYNLAEYIDSQGDSADFETPPLLITGPTHFAPQLVIAIASSEPLEALASPGTAAELMPDLVNEAAANASGLGVAIGYFKLGS